MILRMRKLSQIKFLSLAQKPNSTNSKQCIPIPDLSPLILSGDPQPLLKKPGASATLDYEPRTEGSGDRDRRLPGASWEPADPIDSNLGVH